MRLRLIVATAILALGTAAFGASTSADRQFVEDAYSVENGQIDIAGLAAIRGTTPEVRSLRELVARDQEAARAELGRLAADDDLPMTGWLEDPEVELYKRIAGMPPSVFDRAYVDGVAATCARALDIFAAEAQYGQRPELRAFARAQIIVIRAEIDLAHRVLVHLDSL